MAKRSDFAQKLLDDLRLRKERMGLAQATQPPQPRAADAHEGSRWSFRGSGERISRKTSGKQMLGVEITQKTQRARYSRTPTPETASTEIVPVGRAGKPKQAMGLSRGLTVALTYGGRNLNWDLYSNSTNKGFILQQTSANFRGRENRHHHSTVPYVSQIHIEEISKCADKINKILRACSNGLKLDRESIHIGRELLRGAIDLEESLRMLASLQEASEYMANTQRKQVRLLKEKEDEDEPSTAKAEQQMTLSKPRLSLYGTQCSPEAGKQQGQGTLFDTGKPTIKPKSGKHTDDVPMKAIYQRKPTSSGPTFKPETPFSAIRNDSNSEKVQTSSDSKAFVETASRYNTSNHTNDTRQLVLQDNSGHEKARIPNVIAKLMGLEDLPPPNRESNKSGKYKVAQSTQGTRTNTNSRPNAEEATEVHVATLTEKAALKKEVSRKVIQEKESAMTLATRNIEVVKGKERTNLKILNTESASPVTTSSEKLLFKNVQSEVDRKRKLHLQKEHKAINEAGTKGKQNVTHAELTLKETQDPSFDSHATKSKPHRHQHNEHGNQDFHGRVQRAQTDAKGSLMQDSQPKRALDDRPMQPNTVQQLESRSKASKKEQNVKNESELTNIRTMPTKAKNTKSSREIISERLVTKGISIVVSKRGSPYAIDKKQDNNSLKSSYLANTTIRSSRDIEIQFDKKSANEGRQSRPLKTDSKFKKEKVKPLVSTCRSVLSVKTEQNARTRTHENENEGKKPEEAAGSQSPNARDQPVEQHISILQERTQAEENNGRAGDEIMSLHSSQTEQHLQEKAQAMPHCHNPVINDCMVPKAKLGETLINTDSHETRNHATPVQQLPGISIREDQEPCFLNVMETPVPGSTDSRQQHTGNYNSFKQHGEAVSKFDRQELLTDDENHLREILVKSQLFLNDAQALFNIKIPVGIIQAGKIECRGEQSKITLDCGYEVMRRKGKREELALLSPTKILSAAVKVRCLDDLTKELDKDLKTLKFSCWNEEYFDTSEFLQKMLERDINDNNPDVNCMWDLSWKNPMFAHPEKNEVIREVEKRVLNSLINEIVKDFLM